MYHLIQSSQIYRVGAIIMPTVQICKLSQQAEVKPRVRANRCGSTRSFSICEVEAGGSGVQGHPQLLGNFEVSLFV